MDTKIIVKNCIEWIRDWFKRNGNDCVAVIGLSGGKNSTIAAKLCVEALGASRVVGVSMPDEDSGQTNRDAEMVANMLKIELVTVPITWMLREFTIAPIKSNLQSEQNLPARIRMTVLYYVAQSINGRVCGTTNYSEEYLGYMTRWGDQCSDFTPLKYLTATEVKNIGRFLGIPEYWINKLPEDGLPHSESDEKKFGFTYDILDKYITCGESEYPQVVERIEQMHKESAFKRDFPEAFDPQC